MHRTLAIIKPDAVERNLTGRILGHLEEAGFRVRAIRSMTLTTAQAREFYAVHKARPFYDSLVAFIT
jgi:nucleoside-diphosphate kinase